MVEGLVFAAIQQQLEPRHGIQARVRAALGAHVPIGLQVLLPENLAAALALPPEALGAHAALGVAELGELLIVGFVALEPRHA